MLIDDYTMDKEGDNMFENIREQNIYKNLLDGKWVQSSSNKNIKIHSPRDNSVVGMIQAMTKEEVDLSIASSNAAAKVWRDVPINERAVILNKAALLLEENMLELYKVLQYEIGKDKESSISEITRSADFIRFTADEGKHMEGKTILGDSFPGFNKNKISMVTRVPLGTVLAISPFNYPINLSVSKIAPALIAGNSVILKPPTSGSISALHMAEIFNKAGLPKGVLNTVTGKGSDIGDYLVTHKGIDFINFTGSTEVGRHIASMAGMVPTLLELGGKDAALVLDDADLDLAAKEIASGAFSYSGQRCTAIKRVIVLNSIAPALICKIKAIAESLRVDALREDCEIVPLINMKAADFVQELIDDAINKGANLILGNKRIDNLIYPTIFDNVTSDMRIAWEEPFGPILPIIRVNSIEEAVKVTNSSKYGLQASIFTNNINKAFFIADKLQVGTVQINGKTERSPDHFPFSGFKSSGMGTQGIRYSIEAMSKIKSIVLNLEDFNEVK